MKVSLHNGKIAMMLIMLIPIFQPKIFSQYNSTTMLYIIFNAVEIMCFLIYIIFFKEYKGVHWPVLIWIIYRIYILFVMLVTGNSGGILQWGYLSLMVTNLLFVCEYALDNDIKNLLKGITYLGIILLVINFTTLLIFDRGIIRSTFYEVTEGDQYFLGIKTQFTTMMFPCIAASGALYLMKKNKKNRMLVIISALSCCVNIFNKSISTAIVGIVIVVFMVFLRKFRKVKWNFKRLFVCAMAIQIAIVYFNIQQYFSTFIENYLHKDASLSSRVFIWESAKKLISEESILALLFGNGTFNLNAFVPHAGGLWQPHNQLLVWIYTTGLIGTLIVFLFIMMFGNWKTEKNEVYYYLSIVAFSVSFLSVSEVYFDVAVCYVPFMLLYYIGKYYERRL